MYSVTGNRKKTDEDQYVIDENGKKWTGDGGLFLRNGTKWGNKNREGAARERWKLLAKALSSTKTTKAADISVRRFSSFGLIVPNTLENQLDHLEDCWLKFTARVGQRNLSVEIRLLHRQLTATELMGFNNTGNVCVWPSEEVLAWYILPRAALFAGKSVLELGGGMTCLAGVMLAKYSQARLIHLTDGNELSVDNVKSIVQRNLLPRTTVSKLNWFDFGNIRESFDVILSADCLFFDDARIPLVETLWQCLTSRGVALVMAPSRGGTLIAFVQCARSRGFTCTLHTRYCDFIWKQHQQFKQSCPEYDEDLHYPLLLLLSKDH